MKIFPLLENKWKNATHPFLIHNEKKIYFNDIKNKKIHYLGLINPGDIVIVIGDYNELSISLLFHLIESKAIIVPLTKKTNSDYEFHINASGANIIIENNKVKTLNNTSKPHPLIIELRKKNHPGLIFFSTGTTGDPKAILHDVTLLFERFKTPRKAYITINFLMFDHMGGINTLLHTLFNGGTVITPKQRAVDNILDLCEKNNVELLPATPTFLRMLLLSGAIPKKIPKSLKVISYGTELMDQGTLNQLCDLLPKIDFKQTYGLSEFCVLRIKNRSRKDLFIKISGEGVDIKIENKKLFIRSELCMMGYLNAKSPFDSSGWYDTRDIVEEDENGFLKIVGRDSDIVNVGGLKFMKSEVENIILTYEGVAQTKIITQKNPITGQHIEAIIEQKPDIDIDLNSLKKFLKINLASHMRPQKIKFQNIEISSRFKKK